MSAQNILKISALAAAMGMASSGAFAESSATQTINYSVPTINQISVADASLDFDIVAPDAGSAIAPVTGESSYSFTTNGSGMKITAALTTGMPSGVTLTLVSDDPDDGESGATPAATLTLTGTAQDLVTNITQQSASSVGLDYELSATLEAAVVDTADTLTLTITSGS